MSAVLYGPNSTGCLKIYYITNNPFKAINIYDRPFFDLIECLNICNNLVRSKCICLSELSVGHQQFRKTFDTTESEERN